MNRVTFKALKRKKILRTLQVFEDYVMATVSGRAGPDIWELGLETVNETLACAWTHTNGVYQSHMK